MANRLCTVTFEPTGETADVAPGTTVRAAAELAGVDLASPCGGLGTCGRCVVSATGDVEDPRRDELTLLTTEALARGTRLACQARVAGDVTVRPLRAVPPSEMKIVESGNLGEVSVEPPERRGLFGPSPLLGAVVDVGTTTLVASIVDLRTGETLGSASALNPQAPFGDDVLSRITSVAKEGARLLREPVAERIEDLIASVLTDLDLSIDRLREVALAGNTTMLHILLGIDPAPLGVAPYTPAHADAVERSAAALGFTRLGTARAYALPGISAFLGADITAGLLTTRLPERETPALLLDLGTNGEIVLWTGEHLFGASTAAGPALEGASLESGMLARGGAIERVALQGDSLVVGTIDDLPAAGICGSGVIDLVAALLDAGVIDTAGLMRDDVAHPLAARVTVRDGVRAFDVAPGVFLTQKDVRSVQLAISAVATGIELLLESAAVPADSVAEVIVAGGFGRHVRGESLA
ncbi:MAG TPA: ASKHA domain-containing protein, partial [Coriobacteriia bacterium]